ncbi:hypothetical protein D4764_14G0011390, partial [Takifugu flavidus]
WRAAPASCLLEGRPCSLRPGGPPLFPAPWRAAPVPCTLEGCSSLERLVTQGEPLGHLIPLQESFSGFSPRLKLEMCDVSDPSPFLSL